jgi:hypothetical protein
MDDTEFDQRINVAFRHLVLDPEPPHGAMRPVRSRSRSRLLLVPSVFVLAILALVANNLTSPTPVDASWSAVPTSPEPNAAALASQGCHLQEAGITMPLRLMDHRGRTTIVLYAEGGNDFLCDFTVGSDGTVVDAFTATGRFDPQPPASGLDLLGVDMGPGPLPGSGPVLVVGRGPANAAQVKVALASGVTVTASSGNGFYLAWWPKSTPILSIVAEDAEGRAIAQVDQAAIDTLVPHTP